MKARNISDRVNCKVDDLVNEITESDVTVTIGIGDGGNEVGMGKVFDKVVKFIGNGEKIACVTKTDLLMACGTFYLYIVEYFILTKY